MAERETDNRRSRKTKNESRARAYVTKLEKDISRVTVRVTWPIPGRELRHFTRTTATCTIFSIS